MSASEAAQNLYEKHAPRWIKVIRWREWGQRVIAHQKFLGMTLYIPLIIWWNCEPTKLPYRILVTGADNPLDIAHLRRNINAQRNPYHRDWDFNECDEFRQMVPIYDLSKRRLEYPQYYEGRYKDVKKTVWGEVLEVKPKKAKKETLEDLI